jgi:protein AATF/BFR2
LGRQYAGLRVSRKALQDKDDEANSDHEDSRESPEPDNFADPEASDFDVDDEEGDIDSDAAFGESDAEKFKGFTFRGSSTPKDGANSKTNGVKHKRKTAADFMSDSEDEGLGLEEDHDMATNGIGEDEDVSEPSDDAAEDSVDETDEDEINGDENDDSESDPEDEESGASEDDDEDDEMDDAKSRRAELRRIMNEEQKTVVATISQAAKADAEKGNAVKQQRKTFDSLLNVRIRLQKALVASNSMTAENEKPQDDALPYQAAEEAAIKLLNTLDAMRQELTNAGTSTTNTKKRKRTVDINTPSSAIWVGLQSSEPAAVTTRQTTLEKWSARVKDATAHPVSRRLNTAITQQTITDVLQEQLSNSERLVKRTKMPRSCAPVQAKLKLTEDPNIYDDADFYQLLLKELVDQRMMDSSNTSAPLGDGGRPIAQWTAVKEAKTKKNVDTKASKGRKMRYTVHEKLQNFMAPEDRTAWEQDAIDRFFGTLLGQKMSLGEEDEEMSDGDEGVPLAEEALMLFRS